jgi:hypothetical protein
MKNDEISENENNWTEEQAKSMGYAGLCPDCGSPTINCVVADAACTNDACNYVAQKYSGTIYG